MAIGQEAQKVTLCSQNVGRGTYLDRAQSILMSPIRMAFKTAWARSWESSFW